MTIKYSSRSGVKGQRTKLISSHESAGKLYRDIYHEGRAWFFVYIQSAPPFLSPLVRSMMADWASPPPTIYNVYESCQLLSGLLFFEHPLLYVHISSFLYTYASLPIIPIGPFYPVRQTTRPGDQGVKQIKKSLASRMVPSHFHRGGYTTCNKCVALFALGSASGQSSKC